MVDISIVIVNYQSKGFVLNCIKSIKESDWAGLKYEIIVVDNNSDDDIGKILYWQYPDVVFLQNEKNTGMGAGNNTGLKKAKGDYLVVMNPDTIVFPDTFKLLFVFMEKNKKAGVVGPQLLNPDKSIQKSCFRWYGLFTPIFRRTPLGKLKIAQSDIKRFLMDDFEQNKEREVDWLMGSFLFCRAKALKEIGYFDERFFMYFEDTDLCRSFWNNNWQVIYYPEVKVIHNHMRQSAKIKWYKFLSSKSARWHISSWLKYLLKWGPGLPKSK